MKWKAQLYLSQTQSIYRYNPNSVGSDIQLMQSYSHIMCFYYFYSRNVFNFIRIEVDIYLVKDKAILSIDRQLISIFLKFFLSHYVPKSYNFLVFEYFFSIYLFWQISKHCVILHDDFQKFSALRSYIISKQYCVFIMLAFIQNFDKITI